MGCVLMFHAIISVRKVYVFFILVALGGCATPNVKTDYTLTGKNGKGLLVASLSVSGDAGNAGVNFRREGEKDHQQVAAEPFDWEDEKSRLIVVELPIGRYEMYEWVTVFGGKFVMRTRLPNISFAINEGKITYIGNLCMGYTQWSGKRTLQLTDKRDRDLSFFRGRYKNISESDILIDIAKPQ